MIAKPHINPVRLEDKEKNKVKMAKTTTENVVEYVSAFKV